MPMKGVNYLHTLTQVLEVARDDHISVVPFGRVVAESVDHSIRKRMYRSADGREKIDAHMDVTSAPVRGPEERRFIHARAFFMIPADREEMTGERPFVDVTLRKIDDRAR